MADQRTRGSAFLAGLLAGFLAVPGALEAAEIETPASIRAAIQTAVAPRLATVNNAMLEIAVGAIDTRLQLPSCPALEVTLPPTNTAIMTAKVACDVPNWTIYVPVRLHAWVDAVVAAANLAPNTRIVADQLSRGRVDMFSSNGGLVTDPNQAEGKILRIGLLAGAPLQLPFLELPILVHRGQKVLVTLLDDTMTIKATALALEDGRAGESITVENPDSKKPMRATVAEDGTVQIRF